MHGWVPFANLTGISHYQFAMKTHCNYWKKDKLWHVSEIRRHKSFIIYFRASQASLADFVWSSISFELYKRNCHQYQSTFVIFIYSQRIVETQKNRKNWNVVRPSSITKNELQVTNIFPLLPRLIFTSTVSIVLFQNENGFLYNVLPACLPDRQSALSESQF